MAAEITYLHFLSGNLTAANETAKYCEEYLKSECLSAKRILATIAYYSGKLEEATILIEQAKKLLKTEEIEAERLLEEKLLANLFAE